MKHLFRGLAKHLATPEGLRQARLLQMAGLAGAPEPARAPPE